jgi:Ni2+-binding GTPase involved in maturation of urease and hydrogenase
MRLITVSGPPSAGKTAVVCRVIEVLREHRTKIGVVKFDCLSTDDDRRYARMKVLVRTGLSGALCPDHYFVSNIEACFRWGLDENLDILISESAGLCNRCSPHIGGVTALCVMDNLSGHNTPRKIGPMLKSADIVVITKGDIVSQAEREVFAFRVKSVNPKSTVMHVNGLTGQGAEELARLFLNTDSVEGLSDRRLRFAMPMALCSYCLGETRIGEEHQKGTTRKMRI